MGVKYKRPEPKTIFSSVTDKNSGLIKAGIRIFYKSDVYIEDFLDGLMLLMDKGEHLGVYHVGTTEEIAIEEVAAEVGRYFGRETEVIPGERLRGSPLRRCPDIAKMLKLGYKPGYKFREGLKITARWYDNEAESIEASGRTRNKKKI